MLAKFIDTDALLRNHTRLSTAALKVKIEGPNFRKRMTITTIKTIVSFDILMPPTDYFSTY